MRFDISREVFDYEASVSGTIRGIDAGEVTLVAYCGISNLLILLLLILMMWWGLKQLTKNRPTELYPGYPSVREKRALRENVQIFALLDANSSQTVDGDKIGLYGRDTIFSFTINAGTALTDIDIEFKLDIKAPCGIPRPCPGKSACRTSMR
ncbi:MAG: hypothetical protein R2860_02170 [Desulfobacterales bacterium]